MPDKNAFIVISKNYIVSHHFCICDVWNFIFFMIVDFGDNLVCYWNKTLRLRGIEFLFNNEYDTICYNLILFFGRKNNLYHIFYFNHKSQLPLDSQQQCKRIFASEKYILFSSLFQTFYFFFYISLVCLHCVRRLHTSWHVNFPIKFYHFFFQLFSSHVIQDN